MCMPAESRVQDIFLRLKKAGFAVYFPAQKQGECTSPYVVVKEVTESKVFAFSSTITYFELLCYVPKDHYSTLAPFVKSVAEAMKGLVPMIMPTYEGTDPFYDDEVKGHMVSIQFRNYKKI